MEPIAVPGTIHGPLAHPRTGSTACACCAEAPWSYACCRFDWFGIYSYRTLFTRDIDDARRRRTQGAKRGKAEKDKAETPSASQKKCQLRRSSRYPKAKN